MASTRARCGVAAPIRKGTSKSADNSEPSFLTTLPPEIRNNIYECVFLRDEPIFIVDAHEYTKPPVWDEKRPLIFYDDDDDGYDGYRYVNKPMKAHDCQFAVTLLRTCRQIYSESSGLFYGANDFVVSSVGSHYYFLNKVAIDIGPQCPDLCYDHHEEIDIMQLVKLLWTKPAAQLRLTFADSGRALDKRIHLRLSQHSTTYLPTQPNMLNNILESLVVKDDLKIRRYSRFDCLVHEIALDTNLRYGRVVFNSSNTSHGCWTANLEQRFTTSATGMSSAWCPPVTAYSLPIIRGNSFERILRYALASEDPIVFDLDEHKDVGFDNRLCAVNRTWSLHAMDAFRTTNVIILRMLTLENKTSFSDFCALCMWHQDRISRFWPDDHSPPEPPSIELCFSANQKETCLQSLEINIVELIKLTRRWGPTNIVKFKLETGSDERAVHSTSSLTMGGLHRNCFVALSECLVHYPAALLDEHLQVWIDGEGRVRRAVIPASEFTYERDTANALDLSMPSQLLDKDYSALITPLVEKIMGHGGPYPQCRFSGDVNSLIGIWMRLKESSGCWDAIEGSLY
ncbi:hypothetical protein CC86DRAFT_412194 [Ophiobolus disseminans]|uniref:DUF7730 domain-containing protein n=1 Tax=Ophiobolus disseminans TaxID=1469910 RepID=A0A6A6ZHZ1_9PLEO|nr:hypothetical protein CC86DRAFT_412194 [Ophiobolus disseminans]